MAWCYFGLCQLNNYKSKRKFFRKGGFRMKNSVKKEKKVVGFSVWSYWMRLGIIWVGIVIFVESLLYAALSVMQNRGESIIDFITSQISINSLADNLLVVFLPWIVTAIIAMPLGSFINKNSLHKYRAPHYVFLAVCFALPEMYTIFGVSVLLDVFSSMLFPYCCLMTVTILLLLAAGIGGQKISCLEELAEERYEQGLTDGRDLFMENELPGLRNEAHKLGACDVYESTVAKRIEGYLQNYCQLACQQPYGNNDKSAWFQLLEKNGQVHFIIQDEKGKTRDFSLPNTSCCFIQSESLGIFSSLSANLAGYTFEMYNVATQALEIEADPLQMFVDYVTSIEVTIDPRYIIKEIPTEVVDTSIDTSNKENPGSEMPISIVPTDSESVFSESDDSEVSDASASNTSE